MLITGAGVGDTVEDVLRALGAVLDERNARGVVLIEVPDGLVIRARVSRSLDLRINGDSVSMEEAFGAQEILAERMAAVARRGSGHEAGPLERALRILGRYIDSHKLRQITLMEHDGDRGWLLWHRSVDVGRHVLITFDHDEIERSAAGAQLAREGTPQVAEEIADMELPELLRVS